MPAIIPPIPYDPGSGYNPHPGGNGYKNNEDKKDDKTSPGKNNYTTKTCKLEVVYNANGATGNPPSSFSQTYSGKLQPVTISTEVKDNENGMSKGSGYYFLGWATSSNGSVVYNPGDTITKQWTENQSGTTKYTLYAVWTNHSIFIYSPDEHTKETRYNYSDKPLNQQTYIKGAIFHRTGYTQVGWATTEGGAKVYDLNQSYTSTSNEVVTLYPAWLVNTYTVTLYPNGGTGEVTQYSVDYGDEIEIPLDIFTKTNYHINVYNESADGSNSSWIPGGIYVYTRESDVNLYAIWAGDEYYVVYDDGMHDESQLQVNGILYSSLLIDDNGYLYSEYLRKTEDDLLYIAYPGYSSLDIIDADSAPYSIATIGSPFYTERIPYPEDRSYCSFTGWRSDDNHTWVKQHASFDAYSYASNPIWTRPYNVVLKSLWNDYYPFGKIFFNNKYSDECGVMVEEPPSYVWPEYQYDHQKVKGKNGDVLGDPDRFENVIKKYKISAYDGTDFYSVASKVSEWLHCGYNQKYIRLEDSYEPDVYRLATYEETNTLENLLAKAGKCELSFNCKPQKFLISGDKRIDIAYSGKSINNPTSYPSLPILIFNGAGTIRVNGREIIVYNNFNTIRFDAESYDAVDVSGINMNRYICILDQIVLNPGVNTITYEGDIYDLSIIPRWWKI